MTLRLYNTLTLKIEEFSPPPRLRTASDGQAPHEVTMYNCGPTVYDRAQIGNLRAFLFADILRRTLTFAGYTVKQVMNITDVDDKTIRGSRQAGKSLTEFTRAYEEIFFEDLKKMNVLTPTITPRATEHIPDMIGMIERLLKGGFAYRADDGVYFDVAKSKNYGILAGLEKRTETRARVKNDEYDKADARDFALWKFYVPEDGDVSWEAPFGKGRPGWHIECSAMSQKHLGETIDIHTGGIDLVFPHHTNEIAQSECATGKPFVRFWLHNAHLLIDGQKMSKSLGNTYRLSDIEAKGISPMAFRYWLLTAHYRTQVNFTWDTLAGAQKAYDRLREKLFERQKKNDQRFEHPHVLSVISSIFDDLNTATEIGRFWEEVNDPECNPIDLLEKAKKLDELLGLNLLEWEPEAVVLTPELQKLLDERRAVREKKDFAESDRLREEIRKLGYGVKDTSEGQELTKLS